MAQDPKKPQDKKPVESSEDFAIGKLKEFIAAQIASASLARKDPRLQPIESFRVSKGKKQQEPEKAKAAEETANEPKSKDPRLLPIESFRTDKGKQQNRVRDLIRDMQKAADEEGQAKIDKLTDDYIKNVASEVTGPSAEDPEMNKFLGLGQLSALLNTDFSKKFAGKVPPLPEEKKSNGKKNDLNSMIDEFVNAEPLLKQEPVVGQDSKRSTMAEMAAENLANDNRKSGSLGSVLSEMWNQFLTQKPLYEDSSSKQQKAANMGEMAAENLIADAPKPTTIDDVASAAQNVTNVLYKNADEQRKQETHELNVQAKQQQMEIADAKAETQGVVTKPVDTIPEDTAYAQARNSIVAQNSNPQSLNDLLSQRLVESISQIDPNEKSLRYSSLGPIGALLGLPLNLVSAPFGKHLGSEIFGGKASPEQMANKYARLTTMVSPLIRSEMFSERQGLDSYARLRQANLPVELASFGRGSRSEDVDDVIGVAIDIRKKLANDVKTQDFFGSDASTDFGKMFDVVDNIDQVKNMYGQATSPDQLEELKKIAMQSAVALQQMLTDYMLAGGTQDTLLKTISEATNVVDENFVNEDLVYQPGESKESFQFRAMRKATGNAYVKKLNNFYDQASSIMKYLQPQLQPVLDKQRNEAEAKSKKANQFRSFGTYGQCVQI